jgi:hypothetical protein
MCREPLSLADGKLIRSRNRVNLRDEPRTAAAIRCDAGLVTADWVLSRA